VSLRFTNRPIIVGIAAASISAILGSAASPHEATSAISIFLRAGAYILVVFTVGTLATFLSLPNDFRTIPTRSLDIALRAVLPALWLPSLLMFSEQRSWFVLIVWGFLLVEVARLLAFVRHQREDESNTSLAEAQMFLLLDRHFSPGFSIFTALVVQSAIFAAIGGHDHLAAVLYLAGTISLACRVLRMFEEAPDPQDKASSRIPTVLPTAILLVAFAWLPYAVPSSRHTGFGSGEGSGSVNGLGIQAASGERGTSATRDQRVHQAGERAETWLAYLRAMFSRGNAKGDTDSFTVARRLLDSALADEGGSDKTPNKGDGQKNKRPPLAVLGAIFPGVVLYPEVEKHIKLVAPPILSANGGGTENDDPLSIPFNGVYWFWRGPRDQPPSNSVVMHGTPSARFFRSTDGEGMSMEARQNLGFMVDAKAYRAIELVIENADPFPDTVSIILKIRNTSLPGKPTQNLGIQQVSTTMHGAPDEPGTPQTLTFRIPGAATMTRFDELILSFGLKGQRTDRSARIAVKRFRLLPRIGG
jgi:hypothetical protein